ncbi:MAG: SDR family NAD(P)-dependent oxidoreductase [Herpetosiphonaceae bacterium]|nr:SDR family NAD(P)-dependent oxidoreductase [Herpetosiphonaceae bacterium]
MTDATMDHGLDGVAIVGMAGRFPGAANVDILWENLCNEIESITFFSHAELAAAGVDPAAYTAPNYVPARGALGNAEYFDAAFFGHSPRVAELMDPQHRLFLECAWEALENAGYDSEQFDGRIGVYAGESMNTYLLNNLYSHIQMVASLDSLQAAIGNDKDSLTTEVAYKFNLKGPCVTIQTASSTSLAAVHQACQSLLSYECDMALAGGVSIHFPEQAGYLYQQGGATSPDGHCRAFDAKAQGFVNGHGAGVVVLRRVEEALADGDMIYAVIKGSAINNDGSVKVSYMAPSVDGQAEVIGLAQAIAGVEADTISYVEAHGTGTMLGDPIEIAGLTQAFRNSTQKTQFCAIGSIKPNIGHLDTAAGVAGLIKTALALTYKQIPASLHWEQPNPQIDFEHSPFFVNTVLRDWEAGSTPRRAGVSSFGMGGTNAHVVVEEAPGRRPAGPSRPWQLLLLSAKTETALETATTELADYLDGHPDLSLADAAYTLHIGRRGFNERRIAVCRNVADAVEVLHSRDPQRLFSGVPQPGERAVVYLFPGQGSQYVNMGRDLYDEEQFFRATVDQCAELLQPHLGLDLRTVLYPEEGTKEATARLDQTALAQPALFVIEYALAQLWQAWGIVAQGMIGHSIGEYVAACLAGVMSLADALALVAARGRLMQSLPAGAMLAVPLAENEVLPWLGSELALAAVNAPRMCVVSGPIEAITALEAQLRAQEITSRPLHTSHAFHSAMLEPILADFTALVRRVPLQPPQQPYISNVTGSWITSAEATDPRYWAQHLRQTVRFADGLQTLLQGQPAVLLEVGPGQALSTFARQHTDRSATQLALPSLRHPHERQSDHAFMLTTLGKMWLTGIAVDASTLYSDEQRWRVPLPTYPFERQRYWVEPLQLAAPVPPNSQLEQSKRAVADWFYLPFWKPTLPVVSVPPAGSSMDSVWLLFVDKVGLGVQVAQRLLQEGRRVISVAMGSEFARQGDADYLINPQQAEDYRMLLGDLQQHDSLPQAIVHLWNVTADTTDVDQTQALSFYSLVFLTQALAAQPHAAAVQLQVVSNNVQPVNGTETLDPSKATLLGACKVIPQEYRHISCRSIDVELSRETGWSASTINQLLAELQVRSGEPLVAFRNQRRWIPTFEAVHLPQTAAVPRVRNGGVYLITGGLGGIGLEIARHLTSTAQAKLVLVGRTVLPDRSDWATWLGTHSPTDAISQKLQQVQALEQLGADVLLLNADVSNGEQMQAVINAVETRFGGLHGVIHAAGMVGAQAFQPLQTTTREVCEEHFAAKLYGVRVLDKVLGERPLDFCILISSLAAVLGGLGMAAYAAANLAMDTYTSDRNRRASTPWTTINWDAWHLNDASEPATGPGATSATTAITRAEGTMAFDRILTAGPMTQVVVAMSALEPRIERWLRFEAPPTPAEAEPIAVASLYPRPSLQNAYVAPHNELEQTLAQMWQAVLKIEQVGIHDNFFELGGNSLTGIQMIGQLQTLLGVQLPTVSLYEGPTVSALAKLIDPDQQEQMQFEESRNRGERRREKRRERKG